MRAIRADFERRGNEAGLEILASYEEGWAEYGRLTERQIAWLERQLAGSWRRTATRPGGGHEASDVVAEPQRQIVRIPPTARGLGQPSPTMLPRSGRAARSRRCSTPPPNRWRRASCCLGWR